MTDPEALYNELASVEKLKGLNTEDQVSRIGQLVDLSFDLKKVEGLRLAIQQLQEFQKNEISIGQLALSHYFLANAWAGIRRVTRTENDLQWQWEQEEYEHEIVHLRKALTFGNAISLYRRCQILTNLGNNFDQVGRFVEAIEYWEQAITLSPTFGMAIGNRGHGLMQYAEALYDEGHRHLFLTFAHSDLAKALQQVTEEYAAEIFKKSKASIEKILPESHLVENFDVDNFSLGDSEEEIRYRRWCLTNKLFLNPLNDLGVIPIAANDVFSVPSIVTGIHEGPYYYGYFNQMKQEFVSARFFFYEATFADKPHFSDKGVLLFNTLDYPVYSLAIERAKAAYRVTYSLFDKIAFFLNHYLSLSIPERKVSFRTLWYRSQKVSNGLRSDFKQRPNWPLRGLFWLSKELFENTIGFRESLEPDARELHAIRNQIEHRYFKVHDLEWAGPQPANSKHLSETIDELAYSQYRDVFQEKTLKLIQLVRAGLIYLSLAIHAEEAQRAEKRGPDQIIPEMYVDVWEDDWKM